LLSGVDEEVWIKKNKNYLKQVVDWRKEEKISTRFLICEGNTLLTADAKYYRAISKITFQHD